MNADPYRLRDRYLKNPTIDKLDLRVALMSESGNINLDSIVAIHLFKLWLKSFFHIPIKTLSITLPSLTRNLL